MAESKYAMNRILAAWSNEVIVDHNVGRSYVGSNQNPLLSIKCMFGGHARYVADGGREFNVDDAAYVVLNEGNAYTIEKRSQAPVETFCVFFPRGLAAGIERDLTSIETRLLDLPERSTTATFNFLEHRRAHGDVVSHRMLRLRASLSTRHLSDAELEEELLVLLRDLLAAERSVVQRIAALPRARSATRMEMFRRVQRSCDYLHAHLDRPLTLLELSNAAAMSPYHFLRSFRAVFGRTPQAYVSTVRISKARELLERTRMTVSEVALSVGFESLPSFSARFKRTFGLAPSAYRSTSRK